MLANGVHWVKAKTMYMAALRFGPRWQGDWQNSADGSELADPEFNKTPEFDITEFNRIKAMIQSENFSAEDIEDLIIPQ